jgi:hypothetical protein
VSNKWLFLLLELEVWQVGRQLEVWNWMLNDVCITQDFEHGKKLDENQITFR